MLPAMKMRWLKRFLVFTSLLLVVMLCAAFYLYWNIREIVVWYANRQYPELMLDLRRASLHWNHIQITDAVLKLRENSEEVVRIPSAKIGFGLSDLGEHRIGTVTITKPHVRITDRLFALKPNEPTAAVTSLSKTWEVQEFKVKDGTAEIDYAGAPLMRFSFAPEFRDLKLSPAPAEPSVQQSVALERIEFLTRDEKRERIGSINRVELKFTENEVWKMNLDEVIIRTPSFNVTPATLNSIVMAPPQVANQAQSQQETGFNFPDFRVGKLLVENGEVFVKDFGETIPEGSFKFGIDTTDLHFGETSEAAEKKHALQLWDIRLAPGFAPMAPFAFADSLQIDFTPAGLLQGKEIAGATLTGMTVTLGQTFRSFINSGNKTTVSATTTQPVAKIASSPIIPSPAIKPWKLRELSIFNSRVTFADLGVGAPNIGFNIDTTLKDIPLSAVGSETAEEIQQQEISDFTITSPLDSFAPVLTMKTVFIRYSIAGLLRREIEEIQVLNPTIYVGEDLFWYFDALSKPEEQSQTPATGPTPPPDETGWKLKRIDVAYGQLVIASDGKARLPLPLQFTTSAENLNLGRLSDLKLALDLKVPKEDYLFPGYKLELRQLGGNIRFDLPPRTGQNNLVQTLKMNEVRWRQFRAQEGWIAVTFDSKGINGQIGAKGYGGYLNGGFTSFFGSTSPWTGWVSGSKVDLKKFTDVMAPGNFVMDGPADFKLEVNGVASSLERLRGNLRIVRGGKMQISKLDKLLADIPVDWYWVKRELTRILLETLRDFTYDTGDASFWYVNDEGNLKLTLHGPSGSRNIDVVLHSAEAP